MPPEEIVRGEIPLGLHTLGENTWLVTFFIPGNEIEKPRSLRLYRISPDGSRELVSSMVIGYSNDVDPDEFRATALWQEENQETPILWVLRCRPRGEFLQRIDFLGGDYGFPILGGSMCRSNVGSLGVTKIKNGQWFFWSQGAHWENSVVTGAPLIEIHDEDALVRDVNIIFFACIENVCKMLRFVAPNTIQSLQIDVKHWDQSPRILGSFDLGDRIGKGTTYENFHQSCETNDGSVLLTDSSQFNLSVTGAVESFYVFPQDEQLEPSHLVCAPESEGTVNVLYSVSPLSILKVTPKNRQITRPFDFAIDWSYAAPISSDAWLLVSKEQYEYSRLSSCSPIFSDFDADCDRVIARYRPILRKLTLQGLTQLRHF